MTKNELRQRLRQQRDSMAQSERESLNEAIRSRLFQSEVYKECNMIFPYMSFRSEVDTGEIIRQALSGGKQVFLPRVNQKDMEFYHIHDLEGLLLNQYGIPEPPEEENSRFLRIPSPSDLIRNGEPHSDRETNIGRRDNCYRRLMLLPGLAFDTNGSRIGYGAGYYDRYLTDCDTDFFKLALAYDFQVVDKIEADIFDVKADAILTPTRLICFNDGAKRG